MVWYVLISDMQVMKVCLLPCGRPIGHWRIWGQKSSSEFFKVVLSAAAAATAEATAAEQESPQSPSLGFSSESAKLFRPKSVHRVSFDGERGDWAPMKHAATTTTQYNAKWENSVVFKYSVAFELLWTHTVLKLDVCGKKKIIIISMKLVPSLMVLILAPKIRVQNFLVDNFFQIEFFVCLEQCVHKSNTEKKGNKIGKILLD